MRIVPTFLAATCMFCSAVFAGDLDTYRSKYETAYGEIVLVHGGAVEKLKKEYISTLETYMKKVQNTGDLDKTTAALAEINRFKESGSVPADIKSKVGDVAKLQALYRKKLVKAEEIKKKKALTLTRQYDAALDKAQRSLVKSGKLDEAIAVSTERKRMLKIINESAAAKPEVKKPEVKPEPVAEKITAKTRKDLLKEVSFFLPLSQENKPGVVYDQGPLKLKGSVRDGRIIASQGKRGFMAMNGGGITFPHNDALNCGDNGMTVSFWFGLKDNPKDMKGEIIWFIKGDWDKKQGFLCRSKDVDEGVSVITGNGHYVSCKDYVALEKRTPHHMALVFGHNETTIYINGQRKDGRMYSGKRIQPSNEPLHIALGLQGRIWDVMFFKRKLEAKEIENLVNSTDSKE